jgi:hypothetical protein
VFVRPRSTRVFSAEGGVPQVVGDSEVA